MSSKATHEEKQRVRNTFRFEEHLNDVERSKLEELYKEYIAQRKAIITKVRDRWIEENKLKLRTEKLKKEIEKSKNRTKILEKQYKIITSEEE